MPFARVRRRGHAQTPRPGSWERAASAGPGAEPSEAGTPPLHVGTALCRAKATHGGRVRCSLPWARVAHSFTEVGAYVLKLQHHSEMEKRAAGSVSLISRGALYAVFQWRKRKISTLAVFRLHSSSFELVASSTWVSPPTPTPQINKAGRDKEVSTRSGGV